VYGPLLWIYDATMATTTEFILPILLININHEIFLLKKKERYPRYVSEDRDGIQKQKMVNH